MVDRYLKARYDRDNEFSKYQMISLKGEPIADINVVQLISFCDSRGTRSDFNVKFLTLIRDLSYTNEILLDHYRIFDWIRANQSTQDSILIQTESYLIGRYYKSQEYIIHDLKRTAEQIVAFTSLLCNTEYVDSISRVFSNSDQSDIKEFFVEYEDFLKNITRIDNYFKHHFTNGINICFNPDEPIITVFFCRDYSKGFGTSKKDGVIKESMEELVKKYNMFLDSSEKIIRELSEGLAIN